MKKFNFIWNTTTILLTAIAFAMWYLGMHTDSNASNFYAEIFGTIVGIAVLGWVKIIAQWIEFVWNKVF